MMPAIPIQARSTDCLGACVEGISAGYREGGVTFQHEAHDEKVSFVRDVDVETGSDKLSCIEILVIRCLRL